MKHSKRKKVVVAKLPLKRMREYTYARNVTLKEPAVRHQEPDAAAAENASALPAASMPDPEKTEHVPETSGGLGNVAYRTDIGLVRRLNEDSVLVAESIYGVADGMGGHNAGEVASSRTRELMLEKLAGKTPDPVTLRQAVEEVNAELFAAQQEDSSISGMGTTLTVMWTGPQKVYLAHVGDSRAYLYRGGKLERITTDHSYVEEMVQQGMLTREQAASSPFRNVITRAIATDETVEVDLLEEERRPGDIWLLCSDGLHGMVKHGQMLEIMASACSLEEKAEALLQAALTGGGMDNISIVLWSPEEASV